MADTFADASADASQQPRIELVYDSDCPNVDQARAAIREALTGLGAPLDWREWDRDHPLTPAQLRSLGSPSVLVNGADVAATHAPLPASEANSCRIYRDAGGCTSGAPSAELIVQAITSAVSRS
jgi:hypothetical protein